MQKTAIVLLSGGLDSTVMLAMALQRRCHCIALTFDYGQKHRIELKSAKLIAAHYGIHQHIITINSECFKSSALVSQQMQVPKGRNSAYIAADGIASTYVPARNTIFLSYAMAFAELYNAHEIHLGANLADVSGYPDCRSEFFSAFQSVLNTATKQSQETKPPILITPISGYAKNNIVAKGLELKAPIDLSWSCYEPTQELMPCGCCDACVLRNEAILSSNIE